MIIHIRYYVVTIVSIFAAIGLGILIGFHLNSQTLYLGQQNSLIQSLETRFTELNIEKNLFSDQLQGLIDRNQESQEFIDMIYQEYTENRLAGMNLAILITSPSYYYADLKHTLEEAGARVSIEIYLPGRSMDVDQLTLSGEAGLEMTVSYQERLQPLLNSEIEKLLVQGKETALLKDLTQKGYLQYSYEKNFPSGEPVNLVVLCGGAYGENQDRFTSLDLDLIDRLRKNGMPLVGVERNDVNFSYQEAYAANQVPFVPAVNQNMGKILLMQELLRQVESWQLSNGDGT